MIPYATCKMKHPNILCEDWAGCDTCGWNKEAEAQRIERIRTGLPAIQTREKEGEEDKNG